MEKNFNVYRVKRALSALKKKNKKYVTIDMLSKWVGVYSDVLMDDLVFFEPMVRMDPTINMNDLVPMIEEYFANEAKKETAKGTTKPKRVTIRKKELLEYESVSDFVYKKMAGPGGLVSPSTTLSDQDLAILAKLVKEEQGKRKKAMTKTKKKTTSKKK